MVEKVTEKARHKGLRDPEYVHYRLTLNTADWMDKSLGAITNAMVNDKDDYIARTSGAASAGQWVTILRIAYNCVVGLFIGYGGLLLLIRYWWPRKSHLLARYGVSGQK